MFLKRGWLMKKNSMKKLTGFYFFGYGFCLLSSLCWVLSCKAETDRNWLDFAQYPDFISSKWEKSPVCDYLNKNFGSRAAEKQSIHDRLLGVFFGAAYGDAFGTFLEFQQRPYEENLACMKGNESFRSLPGEWTDDTSMACCLADAIIQAKGNPTAIEIAHKFYSWQHNRLYSCDGLNIIDVKANPHVDAVKDIGIAMKAADKLFVKAAQAGNLTNFPPEDLNKNAVTNGCIMRMAPVVLVSRTSRKAIALAEVQTKATHNGCVENINMSKMFARALWLCVHQRGDCTSRKKAFIKALLDYKTIDPVITGYIQPLIRFMSRVVDDKSLWKLSESEQKKLLSLRLVKRNSFPHQNLFPMLDSKKTFAQQIFDKKYTDPIDPLHLKFGASTTKFDKDGFLISATGSTCECLATAVWCIATTNSLYDAVKRAANLGQDADTIAAIVGHVAGAIYGASDIPVKDFSLLAHKEWLFSLSAELLKIGGYVPSVDRSQKNSKMKRNKLKKNT